VGQAMKEVTIIKAVLTPMGKLMAFFAKFILSKWLRPFWMK
jgi:hypothetical protein